MDNCIFCKIINKEFDSYCIYEDNDFLVILDKFPSTLAHTIIIPKKHFENVYDLDDNTAQKLFPLIKKISQVLKKELDPDGLNILQNNGVAAGQSVNHFHVHLIPRFENDEIEIKWSQKDLSESDFSRIMENLKSGL